MITEWQAVVLGFRLQSLEAAMFGNNFNENRVIESQTKTFLTKLHRNGVPLISVNPMSASRLLNDVSLRRGGLPRPPPGKR
jgi:hypothetical protein